MKTGIMLGATPGRDDTLDGLIDFAKEIEARDFDSIWMAHIFGFDALTTLALVGRETSRIEMGTAVVPTFPRHPMMMAQQALTASAASGGRLTLGVGLSHQIVIENMLGLSYEKPAKHMREYASVLGPLLRGEPVAHDGELYRVNGALGVPGGGAPPLLIAALGPAMLRVAGSLAQGTITWMTGVKTLASHIVPGIRAAASDAGAPPPRVVAGFPVAIVDDVDAAREKVAKMLVMYGALPSYRAMLDREGLGGPEEIALLGSEAEVGAALDRVAESGVDDFMAAIAPVEEGCLDRTLDFLAGRRAR